MAEIVIHISSAWGGHNSEEEDTTRVTRFTHTHNHKHTHTSEWAGITDLHCHYTFWGVSSWCVLRSETESLLHHRLPKRPTHRIHSNICKTIYQIYILKQMLHCIQERKACERRVPLVCFFFLRNRARRRAYRRRWIHHNHNTPRDARERHVYQLIHSSHTKTPSGRMQTQDSGAKEPNGTKHFTLVSLMSRFTNELTEPKQIRTTTTPATGSPSFWDRPIDR